MPERVWLITARPDEWPIPVRYWSELEPNNLRVGRGTPYVPESRLLAAEARVRELDGIADILAQEINRASEHVANSDALYRTAAAERDALVPLARWTVGMSESQDYPGDITEEQIEQGRTILSQMENK